MILGFESAKFGLITTRTTKLSLQNNNNNNNVLMFHSNYIGLEGTVPYWTFTCIFSWIDSWGNLQSFIIKKISVILEPFQKIFRVTTLHFSSASHKQFKGLIQNIQTLSICKWAFTTTYILLYFYIAKDRNR